MFVELCTNMLQQPLDWGMIPLLDKNTLAMECFKSLILNWKCIDIHGGCSSKLS